MKCTMTEKLWEKMVGKHDRSEINCMGQRKLCPQLVFLHPLNRAVNSYTCSKLYLIGTNYFVNKSTLTEENVFYSGTEGHM